MILIFTSQAAEPNYEQVIDPVTRALYAQSGAKDFTEMVFKATPKYFQYTTTIIGLGFNTVKRKEFKYRFKMGESYGAEIKANNREGYVSVQYRFL